MRAAFERRLRAAEEIAARRAWTPRSSTLIRGVGQDAPESEQDAYRQRLAAAEQKFDMVIVLQPVTPTTLKGSA